jgi:hypothetical protein
MAYLTKDQIKQAIQQHPEEDPEKLVNAFIAQGHQIEGLSVEPKRSVVADVGVGALKGVGRTAKGLSELAGNVGNAYLKSTPLGMAVNAFQKNTIQKIPAVQNLNKNVSGAINRVSDTINQKLQPTNTAQKIGGAIETVAEFAVPITKLKKISDTKNILKLNPAELKKVAGTSLDYLKEKALRKLPVPGGTFRTAEYSMPKQIDELTTEFKQILSNNLEKTRNNAEKLGKQYYDKNLQLFEGNTKAINTNELVKRFSKAISEDEGTLYKTAFERKETVSKAIKSFTKFVENGTNKGLEEARVKWRKSLAGQDGTLNKANEKMHAIIKDVVKGTLPEEKKKLYDLYKNKQAKLFDIQAIIDAKKAAKVGTSKLKEGLKKIGIAGGGVVAYEGIKKLFNK